MSAPFTREEASRLLGVPVSADDRAVKKAYRRLARLHHPDRGGDPGTFHRLQRAYERLTDQTPTAPTVARGRPSRPAAPHDRGSQVDVDAVNWDRTGADGSVLDRDRLAALLAHDGHGAVAPVSATSRGPGSRLNRVAASLSPAFTATLTIGSIRDDRGHAAVRMEVAASGRKARSALDRIEVDGTWTRTRRSTSTALHALVAPLSTRRATAVLVADQVSAILIRLRWPLGEWTVTDEGS